MMSEASISAAMFLKNGPVKRFGSSIQQPVVKKKHGLWKYGILLLLLLALAFSKYRDTNKVEGYLVLETEPLIKKSTVIFQSRSGKEYFCETNSEGDFVIFLPDGTYRAFRIEDKERILSKSIIKCNSAIKCRIVFPE